MTGLLMLRVVMFGQLLHVKRMFSKNIWLDVRTRRGGFDDDRMKRRQPY